MAVAEAKKVGKSELGRRKRTRLRRKLGRTLVTLTVSDLFKVVKNRKDLLGSEMGELRKTKLTRVVPNVRSKQIIFQGQAFGEKQYKPQATFFSVDFVDEKDKAHPLTVDTASGVTLAAEQMKSHKHPVQVRCNCSDFSFRWGWYDAKKRALSGPNSYAYKRKTPFPGGYPKVNPKSLPGYCKHLHTFLLLLQKRRILI